MSDARARYITTAYCLRLLWDRIYEGWSKSASDQGVTVTEEQVLWAIWLMGCGTVTEVARRLRRDKGTISKCVYSLEESGLIIRKAGFQTAALTCLNSPLKATELDLGWLRHTGGIRLFIGR